MCLICFKVLRAGGAVICVKYPNRGPIELSANFNHPRHNINK